MPRSLQHVRKAAFFLLGLFVFLLLLVRSDAAMDGARRGLSLCAGTLLPALFPFLVFSELLVASGAGEAFGRYLGAPVRALFGLSGAGATSFLLGAVCGLPVAATTAAASLERGELSEKEFRRLLLFSNNPSSGFLVAATGVGLFGSREVGLALLVITLLSSLLLGVILRLFAGKASEPSKTARNGAKNELSVTLFTEGVQRAFAAFLRLCALVILFSSLAACLTDVCDALSLSPLLRVALHGTLEMTGGIAAASTLLVPRAAFLAAAFLASFSGLCVCLQIFSIAGTHARIGAYLLARLLQGGIALLLSLLYLRIFRPALGNAGSVAAFAPRHNATLLFSLTLIALLSTLVFHIQKKKGAPQTGVHLR